MTQQELKEALKVITRFYYDECEIEIVSFTRLKEYTLCRFTFDGAKLSHSPMMTISALCTLLAIGSNLLT